MPFGLLWARVVSRNHVFRDGDSDPPREGAILKGERAARCKTQGRSAVSCAKRLNQWRCRWAVDSDGPKKAWGAQRRNVESTIEPSVCPVAMRPICQSTLTTCYGRPMQWTGHYIFTLWFLSSFFLLLFSLPNLSGRRLDVYHTSTHGVALVRIWNAGLKMCCTRLAENTGCKKIAIWVPSHNFVGLYLRN